MLGKKMVHKVEDQMTGYLRHFNKWMLDYLSYWEEFGGHIRASHSFNSLLASYGHNISSGLVLQMLLKPCGAADLNQALDDGCFGIQD